MIASQEYIVNGLLANEDAIGNPVFTWNGTDYIAVPSLSNFKRELESGGFAVNKLLTLKVRLLDASGNSVFESTVPTAQDKLMYNGLAYRIEDVHTDPTLSYIRIIAMDTNRGV